MSRRPPRWLVGLLGLTALPSLGGGSCLHTPRPYETPTAEQVLAALLQRQRSVRTLRAETRMSHNSAKGRVKATVRLMAARGGKLRFDAVSPFDTPLSTLVANGAEFSLVDAKANRHYHGPASACNLARLLHVQLEPDAAITVLGGSTPLIGHRRASLEWDGRSGHEVLTLEGEDRRQIVHLHGALRDGRPRWDLAWSEIRAASGAVLLRIEADDHRAVDGLRMPQRLTIHQPPQAVELDLVFKALSVNLELPAAAFELPPANGLPSERVDCAGPASR
jgi:hypothetical protein